MNQKPIDEVDISSVLETIWRGKWKIITITMIFFILSVAYTSYIPNLFKVTTKIQKSNLDLLYKYKNLNNILQEEMKVKQDIFFDNIIATVPTQQTVHKDIESSYIFELFIKEFEDYDEMITVLSKNENVRKKIKNLNDEDKRLQMINFAKNFVFVKPKNKNDLWRISFQWHRVDEGISLFKSALYLTLVNVKKTLIENINNLAVSIDLENERKIASLNIELQSIRKLNKLLNTKRNLYLTEQSNIAKELGIENNEITATANLSLAPQNSINRRFKDAISSFKDFNEIDNYPYYLRGYKAIDKEIELIKKRSVQDNDLMSGNYLNTREKLIHIKSDNRSNELKNALKTLSDDDVSKWIKFNLELAEIDNQKTSYRYIVFSIIFGFIFGLVYLTLINIYVSNKKR